MRQVWDFLNKIAGQDSTRIACVLLFCIAAVFALIHLFRYRFSLLRLSSSSVIMALAFMFAWQQPFFTEKIHLLEYGFLAWLAARDLHKSNPAVKTAALAMLYVLLIGALDEVFQKCLPYRVGEIRDVITNVISGAFGTALFFFG